MNPDNDQKKVDKLARIRENQRKSRARRQEHIHDLEQKLASLKEEAHKKDVEHRLVVQRLELENKKLRNLLSCSGMPSSTIEEYLHADYNPAITQKVAIPALRLPKIQDESQIHATKSSQCSQSPCKRTNNDILNSEKSKISVVENNPKIVSDPVQKSSLQESPMPQGYLQDQPLCCPPDNEITEWPASGDVLNTTLCAVADELIHQYNTRGVDMAEIQKRLWVGFTKGLTSSDGCRIQNQLLFQVLDEISKH